MRRHEACCPFCGGDTSALGRVTDALPPRERLGLAALVALAAAGGSVAGCERRGAHDLAEVAPSGSAFEPPAVTPSSSGAPRLDARFTSAAVYGAPPVQPAAPRGTATIGAVSVTHGAVSDAARSVLAMRGSFRACYERALRDQPALAGTLRVSAAIAREGNVSSVTVKPTAGAASPGLQAVADCVERRVQVAAFDAADGGTASVAFDVRFDPK